MTIAPRCPRAWLPAGLAAGLAACTSTAPSPQPDAPRDDRSPCAALCDRLGACAVPEFIGVTACTRHCEEDPAQLAGPCREPRLAYEACVSRQACPDVIAAHTGAGDDASPCAAERKAVMTCAPESPAPPFIEFQF